MLHARPAARRCLSPRTSCKQPQPQAFGCFCFSSCSGWCVLQQLALCRRSWRVGRSRHVSSCHSLATTTTLRRMGCFSRLALRRCSCVFLRVLGNDGGGCGGVGDSEDSSSACSLGAATAAHLLLLHLVLQVPLRHTAALAAALDCFNCVATYTAPIACGGEYIPSCASLWWCVLWCVVEVCWQACLLRHCCHYCRLPLLVPARSLLVLVVVTEGVMSKAACSTLHWRRVLWASSSSTRITGVCVRKCVRARGHSRPEVLQTTLCSCV